MNRDFHEVMVVNVTNHIANCTEEKHLMLLLLKLSHRDGNKPTESNLKVSRMLECSGRLSPPGNTFQLCFDHSVMIQSISSGAPDPLLDNSIISVLALVIVVLLLAIFITVLVKNREMLLGATANVMRKLVWSVAYIHSIT